MGKGGVRENTAGIGRVCLINHGPDSGKLCVIIDVVDQNRALVDGPVNVTGVHRQQLNFRSLALTPLSVDIAKNVRPSTLAKALERKQVLSSWSKTTWARKLEAQKVKRNMNDFDRFRSMIVHKKNQRMIGREMASLKKGGFKAVAKARKPVKPEFLKTVKLRAHIKRDRKPRELDEKEKKKLEAEEKKEETKKKKK